MLNFVLFCSVCLFVCLFVCCVCFPGRGVNGHLAHHPGMFVMTMTKTDTKTKLLFFTSRKAPLTLRQMPNLLFSVQREEG